MVIVKKDAPFTRSEIVRHLEDHNIGTRNLFAGNLLHHPAYMGRKDIRVVGKMNNSDIIMRDGFWVGVYPGLSRQMIDYVIDTTRDFIRTYEKI